MTTAIEWVGIIAGSGVVGSVVTKAFDRQVTKATARKTEAEETKIDADAASVLAQTAVTLVAPLQTQIDGLTIRVRTLEAENTATKSKLQLAIDHIRELRHWIGTHIPDKSPPQPPADLGV